MDARLSHPGRHTLDGTARVFLAELLVLPSGVLVAAFLSRQLGPEGYGLFTLAITLVAWVEWSVTSIFARATIKLVGEADDWRPLGTTVVRLHLLVGVGAALVLWVASVPFAALLGEPALATYVQLFALDVPLFALAHGHRNILIGLGAFNRRALASAARWTARLLLVVVLVGLGLSIEGAILGSIGASLVELAVYRFFVRPSLFRGPTAPVRPLWGYALPLFLFALSARLFDHVDLFAIKALGGTAEQAGIYGAAQNLSLAPGIFALSFSPLLLSTLSRILRAGDHQRARGIAHDAMRAVVVLLPLAGLTAGAAPEIVALVFGPAFRDAAPLLAILIFGALALVMISVATAILTAAGKPRWTPALMWPLLLLALAGHAALIPRLGPTGAALVTTLLAGLGALAGVLAVYRLWAVAPPGGSLWRSVLICGLAYAAAVTWPAAGPLLILKLAALGLAILLSFVLLRELGAAELNLARSLLRRPSAARPEPGKA